MRLPAPSYANVMSTVAVFIALGGTSYAVTQLPKGSVGERELKKNAVTSAKLKDGAVTAADLAPSALHGGPRGPRGERGPVGSRGPSDILFKNNGTTFLTKEPGLLAETVTLDTVPAGDWLFTGTAQLIYSGPDATWFHCNLRFGSKAGSVSSVAWLGVGFEPDNRDDATSATSAVVQEAVHLDAPTRVSLRCGHQDDLPVQGRAETAQLSAVRTDNLQIQ